MLTILFLFCLGSFSLGFAIGYYVKACKERNKQIEKLAQDLEPTLEELVRQKGIRLESYSYECRDFMRVSDNNELSCLKSFKCKYANCPFNNRLSFYNEGDK